MTEAWNGHITTVERDDAFGRYWATFNAATGDPDIDHTAAQACADYINTLSDDGTLSDIDCTTTCPCEAPDPDCEQCEAVGSLCLECRYQRHEDAQEQAMRDRGVQM